MNKAGLEAIQCCFGLENHKWEELGDRKHCCYEESNSLCSEDQITFIKLPLLDTSKHCRRTLNWCSGPRRWILDAQYHRCQKKTKQWACSCMTKSQATAYTWSKKHKFHSLLSEHRDVLQHIGAWRLLLASHCVGNHMLSSVGVLQNLYGNFLRPPCISRTVEKSSIINWFYMKVN